MIKLLITIFVLNNISQIIQAGHEVLYNTSLSVQEITLNQIAIIQYESRPLRDYWNTSVLWNRNYAVKHQHQFVLITLKYSEKCRHTSFLLSFPWCKVKAMLDSKKLVNENTMAYLYIDSDAVINVNYSMAVVISFMRDYLEWDIRKKPIAFNQDGPGWACKKALRLGYEYCLNSGAVLWFNFQRSWDILNEWWNSATESYDGPHSSAFTSMWRLKWPWEQAQMYEVQKRNKEEIMILSFPNERYLPWLSTKNPKAQYPTDFVEPWCFCHWPGANCFITHHCASKTQKSKMIELYQIQAVDSILIPHLLELTKTEKQEQSNL